MKLDVHNVTNLRCIIKDFKDFFVHELEIETDKGVVTVNLFSDTMLPLKYSGIEYPCVEK